MCRRQALNSIAGEDYKELSKGETSVLGAYESLWLSLAALLAIPVGITLLATVVSRRFIKQSQPANGLSDAMNCLLASGITLLITLTICLVFHFTGFFEAQFYRPSQRDYGQHRELQLDPEETIFESEDGTELHGWFLKGQGEIRGTVLCFHGSDRNITYTVRNTHWLLKHGFNLFVFDYRGYGRSEGAPSRAGLVQDSVAAIDTVLARPEVAPERLVLYGQSMGGQLAINAAAVRSEQGFAAVVAEATYARHSLHVADKLGQMGPLWLVKWGAWLLTSDEFNAEVAIQHLDGTQVLLIHGKADTGVAPYHSQLLYEAAADPKQQWLIDDLGHLAVFSMTDEDSERPSLERSRFLNYLFECMPSESEQEFH